MINFCKGNAKSELILAYLCGVFIHFEIKFGIESKPLDGLRSTRYAMRRWVQLKYENEYINFGREKKLYGR